MADLWLISRLRVEELTEAETVRLGRALLPDSATSHIWYPDSQPRATAVVRDCKRGLSSSAIARATDILGEFDMETR